MKREEDQPRMIRDKGIVAKENDLKIIFPLGRVERSKR